MRRNAQEEVELYGHCEIDLFETGTEALHN
jgi:hypothetical protein